MKKDYRFIAVITSFFVIASFMSQLIPEIQAKQETVDAAVEEIKTITGEIISLTPRNDPNYIGIANISNDTDYYFMIVDDVQVVHKSGIEDLQKGDIVEITFKQTTKKNKLGTDIVDRTAIKIKFVKPAKKEDELISR